MGDSYWTDQTGGVGAEDTNDLYSISCIDASRCWATGKSATFRATILRTTDGGSTWTETSFVADVVTAGTRSGFQWLGGARAITFVSATHGWVTGYYGWVLSTTDGGATYNPCLKESTTVCGTGAPPATTNCRCTAVDDPVNGPCFGVDAVCPDVQDLSSSENDLLPSQYWLNGLSFVSETQGWTVGRDGQIFMTADGGFSWTAQSISELVTVSNDGAIATTGPYSIGASTPIEGAGDLQAVAMASSTRGWAVGCTGTVVGTTDGSTWAVLWSGSSAAGGSTWALSSALRAVSFSSETDGLAVGDNGIVLKTSDGGASWSQASPVAGNLYGVALPDSNSGYAVGAGSVVLQTTDGGDSWSSYTLTAASGSLYAISFVNAGRGWAVGATPPSPPPGPLLLLLYDGPTSAPTAAPTASTAEAAAGTAESTAASAGSSSEGGSEGGPGLGMIVGIAIGGLVLLVLAGLAVWWYLWRGSHKPVPDPAGGQQATGDKCAPAQVAISVVVNPVAINQTEANPVRPGLLYNERRL